MEDERTGCRRPVPDIIRRNNSQHCIRFLLAASRME